MLAGYVPVTPAADSCGLPTLTGKREFSFTAVSSSSPFFWRARNPEYSNDASSATQTRTTSQRATMLPMLERLGAREDSEGALDDSMIPINSHDSHDSHYSSASASAAVSGSPWRRT